MAEEKGSPGLDPELVAAARELAGRRGSEVDRTRRRGGGTGVARPHQAPSGQLVLDSGAVLGWSRGDPRT